MVDFWYINNFDKERACRIGASDIASLIQDPDNPGKSLAGYGRTPLTVWEEKTGRLQRDPAGLPAEMGHLLEPKALELFVRRFDDDMNANYLFRSIMENSFNRLDKRNFYGYHFETQFYTDNFIVHPDLLHVPGRFPGKARGCVIVDGVTVNFGSPFIVEAKSANFFATQRKGDEEIKGYDFSLQGWQGIPAKHYVQMQFQQKLFGVDVSYLALISNTSDFHVWRVDANPEHQAAIMDTAERMAWHIENDVPPRDMVWNQYDIKRLYPDLKESFLLVGDERVPLIEEIQEKYKTADLAEKRARATKEECKDAAAAIMENFKELRTMRGVAATWQTRKGSESISVKEMIKNCPKIYKKLKDLGLIKKSADSRSVVIK